MRLLRVLFALAAAAVLAVVGLAFLGHGRPAVGTVYVTDVRGPKVTFDGTPHVERGPELRIRVGSSRKTATWLRVNAAQYASCAVGAEWTGTLCRRFELPKAAMTGRQTTLVLIGGAMVGVAAVGLATGRSRG